MGYSQTNSRGVTLYLNSKETTLNGGYKNTIYYFSKKPMPATACDLPSDREVVENARNGMLFTRRKK